MPNKPNKKQFILCWGVFSVIHCIDAWALPQLRQMPASGLREAMMAVGRGLWQPMDWLWGAMPPLPAGVATLLFLVNSLLWGFALAAIARAARMPVCRTSMLTAFALFVVAPALVPCVMAIRYWDGFRPWAMSQMPDLMFPTLTKAQMYEDYDRFTNIVEQVFPLMEVNKQVYGIDIRSRLKENRRRIENLARTKDFVELINDTIVSCQGHHFFLGCNYVAPIEYFKGFVEDKAYNIAGAYRQYAWRTHRGNGIDLPLLYFEGNYYTKCDFTYAGVLHPRGMKLLTCNGQTPGAIVSTLAQTGVELLWDYDLNQHFTPEVLKFCPLSPSGRLLLEFEQKSGAKTTLNIDPATPRYHRTTNCDRGPLVTLLNGNLLYIRLPTMFPALNPFYEAELPKFRGQAIKKVVIDIRNNPGGNDPVWQALLGLLVKDELSWHRTWAFKNTEVEHRYLENNPFGQGVNQYGKVQKIDFLNNEEFWVCSSRPSIQPGPNSLGLSCKIFVLSENVHSSAGNFVLTCAQVDQLVSVGIQNNNSSACGGAGPFAFSLPHSKLIFTIGTDVDLTDARAARDTHHIDLKVRVKPTLEELLDYYSTGDEVGLEKRLKEHDPVFKRVLEME